MVAQRIAAGTHTVSQAPAAPGKLDHLIALFTGSAVEGHASRLGLSREERDILAVLILRRNPRQGNRCDPSVPTIAKDAMVDEKRTKATLRALASRGYIAIEQRRDGITNRTNAYRILWGEPGWVPVVPVEVGGGPEPPRGGGPGTPLSSKSQVGPPSLPNAVPRASDPDPDPEPDPTPPPPLAHVLADMALADATWDLAHTAEALLYLRAPWLREDVAGLWAVGHAAARDGRSRAHVAAGIHKALQAPYPSMATIAAAVMGVNFAASAEGTAERYHRKATWALDCDVMGTWVQPDVLLEPDGPYVDDGPAYEASSLPF